MKRIRANWLVIVFIIFNGYCFHVNGNDFVQLLLIVNTKKKMVVNLMILVYFCLANEFQCYVCSSDKFEACSIAHQSNQTELPIQPCSSSVSSCFLKIESK